MAKTESTMLSLGTSAPGFDLPEPGGAASVTLDSFSGSKVLVVMFICNHCPYVVHVAPALSALAKAYETDDVQFVGINSNDTERYPSDGPDRMIEEKARRDYTFPYLLDTTQNVAKAYRAACTPDFYVFDGDRKLAYCGQLDGTRPNRISSGNYDSSHGESTGASLRNAIDALLRGGRPAPEQIPSVGCNIKWKPGNAPDYFG